MLDIQIVMDFFTISIHPTHSSCKNKSFPFYDDLIIIFVKDRATGINVECLSDMMEEMQREETNNDTNDVEAAMENGHKDFNASISFSPMQSPRSEVFSKAIGVDAEISEKKQKIDSEIRKIPNLTIGEVIKDVCHIANSHKLIDMFFSMIEEGREQLVNAILRGAFEVFSLYKINLLWYINY
ncbi:hypothetical protein Pfo_005363 [Paulownia fortunei]|nr:hypothetical protein Pfo_005363 [Paulownia fortunei]